MWEKIKKMWSHVKSWFATSLFGKIWNNVKSRFFSNDESKVNTAKQEGATLNQPEGEGVKVGQEQEVKGAILEQNPEKAKDASQQTPKEPNGKVIPKPEGQPINLEIIKEAEKGKNDNEKPGEANETGSQGALTIHDGNLVLRVPFGPTADITLWKNLADKKEYLLYVQCGDNVYRITGINQYSSIGGYETGRYIYNINSVLKQDKDGKFHENEAVSPVHQMDAVITLLDLNDETEVKVTRISDKPFPEVEIPAIPTTTSKPEVKPVVVEAVTQRKDGNEKPGEAFSESKGDQEQKHAEKPQDGPVGYIKKITDGDSRLFVQKDYVSRIENNRYSQGTKRYMTYVIIGKDAYFITGGLFPSVIREYTSFPLAVVTTQDGRHVNCNDLLDLNNGTYAKITDISDKPFPKVESPAIPTTTGAPVVDPKITQAQQEVVGNVKSAPGAGQSQSL